MAQLTETGRKHIARKNFAYVDKEGGEHLPLCAPRGHVRNLAAISAEDRDVELRLEGVHLAAHGDGAGDGIARLRRVHLGHAGGRGVGVGLADVRRCCGSRRLLTWRGRDRRAGGDVHAIAVLAGKHQNDGAHHREEQSVLHISPTYGKTPARGERLSAPRLDPEAPAVRAYGYVAVTVGPEDGVAVEAFEHLLGGMAIGVVRADRDDVHQGADGLQERRRA